MPAIVARHPKALYVIAGQTHPEVAKRHGEEYRISLERLARDLGLSEHVVFDDRFLELDDLSSMLADTTIYLTPYRSREQIVSGALTFAIVAGCATVSTPYYYAEDLLASGAGVLVAVRRSRRARRRGHGPARRPGTTRAHTRRSDRRRVRARLAAGGPADRERAARGDRARAPDRRSVDPAGDAPTRPALAPADDGRRRRDRPARQRQRAGASVRLLHRRRRAPGDRRARARADDRRGDPPPHPGAEPGLPAPRLEPGGARHAQLHVLRPPLARRAAQRRPSRTGRLGAGRGRGGQARPGVARAERRPAAGAAAGAVRASLAALDGVRRARAGTRGRRAARCRRDRRPALARGTAGRPATGERHARLVLGRGRPDLRQRPAAAGADRGGRPAGRRRPHAGGAARAVVVRA